MPPGKGQPQHPVIRVAPLGELNAYTVYEHELELLARGSPGGIFLNFALALLPLAGCEPTTHRLVWRVILPPPRPRPIPPNLSPRGSAMLKGTNRSIQDIDIRSFIREVLPAKLRQDLLDLRIVKEADIECAVYFHLRQYIGDDSRWLVLARKHVPQTSHYVDLFIFKDGEATIALELKWAKYKIGKKDKRSLERAREHLGVETYWLSVVPPENTGPREVKETCEEHLLHELVVGAELDAPELEEWRCRRSRLKKCELPTHR
jgi:hypothetical protein